MSSEDEEEEKISTKQSSKVVKNNSLRFKFHPGRLRKHSSVPPAPKPKLTSSHSMRRPSTFSVDAEHLRSLSNSDGLLVVRKKSVFDEKSALGDEEDGEFETIPEEDNNISRGSVKTKKRKTGIVSNLPGFRSDILRFFSRSSGHHKETSNQNTHNSIPHTEYVSKNSQAKHYLLRNAVRRFEPERVKKLLATKDIDINERNHRGITALHEAAIDGNYACLRVLIEYGADINLTDHEGFNALDYAVCGGDFETASYLIHNGACESRIRNGLIGFKS